MDGARVVWPTDSARELAEDFAVDVGLAHKVAGGNTTWRTMACACEVADFAVNDGHGCDAEDYGVRTRIGYASDLRRE